MLGVSVVLTWDMDCMKNIRREWGSFSRCGRLGGVMALGLIFVITCGVEIKPSRKISHVYGIALVQVAQVADLLEFSSGSPQIF